MQANPELEQLLRDRYAITTTDFVAALKALPSLQPWAAALTENEAGLLDAAHFPEERDADLAAATEIAGHAAHLAVTAFTADEVSAGLGVTPSRIRQKRLAGELWAIPDGQRWVFPILQFEVTADGGPGRQIRGLDQVFKALPDGLHPIAITGFLRTPQPDLFHNRPMAPLEWLRDGGDIATAVTAAANTDWYTA